uniref:NADH-ubiquinone oxidoreductase chain 1 n=1 Tax=Mesenchytraeus cf. gelidus SL-2017 TaxID=2052679 RepID=A0A286KAU2_9ANNE|nr:NADH dehydrogenase subunit 1 [Mesenchytraeus cf. gelidus SL-2017]
MMLPFSISFVISYAMALLAMAFYTLMERKFLGYFQLRKGPNKVGLMGLPQPFADAMKLFTKEQSKPTMMNQSPFIAAPVLGLILTLMLWAIYPHFHPAIFLSFGALYFLCVSSMNVYTTFLAGWSSNSKYALLGALRAVAQTISYEVSMSLILLSALTLSMQMDMSIISINSISWVMLMLSPLALMWFITNLAETNRTPFDFAEGESELVSGFNVEYSSGMFALIFMAEYANILMMSLLSVVFFTGALIPSFTTLSDFGLIMKTMMIATLFIWIRATMPRMRYDHLMQLTWKGFLPLSLSIMLVIIPIMYLI